jgi:hypothetical protein
MKRLFIVVEGQTEEEFVNSLLRPYFHQFKIYDVRAIIISKTNGGFVNYSHLKNDVTKLLKQADDVLVTTFVDFFHIPTNLPKYKDAILQLEKQNQVSSLEKAIAEDINDYRFIPYIQLHEFEALLFSSENGFQMYYGSNKKVIENIKQIITEFENPEEINSTSPPSYRIKELVKTLSMRYDKVNFGNTIALEIGIETILDKCPRFKNWVEILVSKMKENV